MSGFPERPELVSEKFHKLQEKFFLPTVDVLDEFTNKQKEGSGRAYRNEVVHGRMLALDMQYALFKEAIYREGILSNLSVDILGAAIGAAGAATSSADASRILSALSGGISGAGTSINKNLYYERTLPALIALMDARRDAIRAEILTGLTLDIVVYPLGRALTDLERYLQAGSIPGAIAAVTSTAGQTKAEAEEKITILRSKAFVDARAQERIGELLDLVDKLPAGAAFDILKATPVQLDADTLAAAKRRMDNNALGSDEANQILGTDNNAKEILKFVLVMMANRSDENLDIWNAAILAKVEG